MRFGETKKAAYEFERDIMKGSVNQRTNKVIAEKVTRYFEDKIRARVCRLFYIAFTIYKCRNSKCY